MTAFRIAFRRLTKSPGFTGLAVASLALGIGANTAVFSLIDAAIFRPLPVRDPENVVAVTSRLANGRVFTSFDYPEYLALRNRSSSLVELAGYHHGTLDLTAGGVTLRTTGALVTANYFDLLGVQPVLGRAFSPDSEATAAAVISFRWWTRQLHSDAGVIGSTVKVNARPFTVIGVAPDGFSGTVIGSAPDVWVPAAMWQGILELPAAFRGLNFDPIRSNGLSWISLAGRPRAGLSVEAVRRPMREIYAEQQRGREARFQATLEVTPVGKARLPLQYASSLPRMMFLLGGVTSVLLLIACANVAGLLVARAVARQKEMAIRLAIGARRRHVAGEFLAESLMLAAIGGGAGILAAVWASSGLETWRLLLPLPIPADLGLDFRVLAFSIAVSLLAGALVGVLAALRATVANPAQSLSQVPSSQADRRVLSARNLLVVSQVALAILLLTGGGLLLRTFVNLQSIGLGFNAERLSLLSAELVRHGYPEGAAITVYPRLLERIQALPGVESAALAQYVPMTSSRGVWSYDAPVKGPIYIDRNAVSPDYFRTMGIPLVRGRYFTARDGAGAQKVALVNESFARRIFQGADPIGRMTERNGPVIVGVVRDNKETSLRPTEEPREFVPFAQRPEPRVSIVIRTTSDPSTMRETIHRAALSLVPSIPISSVRSMHEQLDRLLWQPRLAALVTAAFAALAAVLAMIGVYGAVSFDVSRRRQEIGVRMALGADRARVLGLVLRRGIRLGSLGAVLGLAVAAAASRLLSAMLYGVSSTDPAVFAGVAFAVVLIAALASVIPARRATRVDPIDVLRH